MLGGFVPNGKSQSPRRYRPGWLSIVSGRLGRAIAGHWFAAAGTALLCWRQACQSRFDN